MKFFFGFPCFCYTFISISFRSPDHEQLWGVSGAAVSTPGESEPGGAGPASGKPLYIHPGLNTCGKGRIGVWLLLCTERILTDAGELFLSWNVQFSLIVF
jgi:hypothetical protein